MSDNKTKRDAIVAKIRALLAKTEANGCTESEAIAAAEAVDRLMTEYDLTYTDIKAEVNDDRYGVRRKFYGSPGTRHQPPVAIYCATHVAAYFNCKTYQATDNQIVFFGTLEETGLAQQLLTLLVLTGDREVACHLRSPDRNPNIHGRTVRASFLKGFSLRVIERLRELKATRSTASSTGRSLIVVKDQVTTQKYAQYCRDQRLNLKAANRSVSHGDRHSFNAGSAAGDRADLGGSKIGGKQLRIGG